MVETTLSKHMICAVGCVHAGLPAKELFYRSGGLVTVNPIFAPGLELDVVPVRSHPMSSVSRDTEKR